MKKRTEDDLRHLALKFFARARTIHGTSRVKFQRQCGITESKARLKFPGHKWILMQEDWARAKMTQAMDEVFRSAKKREQPRVTDALKILCRTGIRRTYFLKLVGDEWQRRKAQLPSAHEIILATIREMVESGTPSAYLTWRAVFNKSTIHAQLTPELQEALRGARRALAAAEKDRPIRVYHLLRKNVEIDDISSTVGKASSHLKANRVGTHNIFAPVNVRSMFSLYQS